MDDFKTIADSIKLELKRRGVTMTEAAERCGMTQQNFSNSLSGRKIGAKVAGRLAEEFGMNSTYILTGDGSLMPDRDEAPAPRGGVYIPPELVQMFSDMAATIRSQQEDLARQRGAQTGRSGYHNTEGPDTSRQPGPH